MVKDKVNEALEQGILEGFTDIQTGDMIRQALLQAGFTRMTVARYLPPSVKHMEKARLNSQSGNKMLPIHKISR